MTINDAMKILYENEVNAGVHTFWDAGFNVFIGDMANGIKICRSFDIDEIDSIGQWLIDECVRLNLIEESDLYGA